MGSTGLIVTQLLPAPCPNTRSTSTSSMAPRGPLSPKAEAVLLLGEHLALTNDSLFTGTEHLLQVTTQSWDWPLMDSVAVLET